MSMHENTLTSKSKILVIGARGGIGSSLVDKFNSCDSLTSDNLDLNRPELIKSQDLSKYDIVINATGHSKGTFLGFTKNTYENIISQINVNYISNILLLKRFSEQKSAGTYVWISSDVIDHPRPFHGVYASSKMASQYAMDLIKKEIDHIKVVEIKFGFAKTNFRYNNFLGTKTRTEVNESYQNNDVLDPKFVADQIIDTLNSDEVFKHIK